MVKNLKKEDSKVKEKLKKALYIIFLKVHIVLDNYKFPKKIQTQIINIISDFLSDIIPNEKREKIIINREKILNFCKKNYNDNKMLFRRNYYILKKFASII